MIDAVRGRLADAVDLLAELDSLAEAAGGRLPAPLLVQALAELDAVAAQLVRLHQGLAGALDGPEAGKGHPRPADAG